MSTLLPVFACGSERPAPSITEVPVGIPQVRTHNSVQSATVGLSINYDATQNGLTFTDPAGKGLSYSAVVFPDKNGLTFQQGHVIGTIPTPSLTLVTVTATDALGRQVTDRFSIVGFATGLVKPTLPTTSFRYSDDSAPLPLHFVQAGLGGQVISTDNSPATNRTTDAGATLGRVLFYDTRVSANDQLSCASCHKQAFGFGDTARFSRGFRGALTNRHSMGLANSRFYQRGRFFWDERAATLEAQVLVPIQDSTEMGMTLDDLEVKLDAAGFYGPLFSAAFGTPEISRDRISRALAQYVRGLTSSDSKFDKAFAGQAQPNFQTVFTPEERRGEQVFRDAGCAACHVTNAQVSDDTHNTGLEATITDAGAGNGRFKSPSLRNVAVRPPYMHDGRFTTLEQVVEFYNSGVQLNPGLDPRLRTPTGSPRRLALTVSDKAALVAFLRTLTDSTSMVSAKFADPFR